MDTKDKTARPEKGGQITEPVKESVSGLDVRQLLGLGRAESDPAPIVDAVEIEIPKSATTTQQTQEPLQLGLPVDEPITEARVDSDVPLQSEFKPQSPPSVPAEEVPRPPLPPQRPSRPAFDSFDAETPEVGSVVEQPVVSPEQSQPAPDIQDSVGKNDQRPIPPVTHPSEISRLRPSIDPLAATASLAAARPQGEDATPSSKPDPSIAANAKLAELASLSERTLEDYETFDDFDDAEPQRSQRTPLIILASLLCVGILAGGVIFAYRQGVRESSNTTLPMIVADTKPIKEEQIGRAHV